MYRKYKNTVTGGGVTNDEVIHTSRFLEDYTPSGGFPTERHGDASLRHTIKHFN